MKRQNPVLLVFVVAILLPTVTVLAATPPTGRDASEEPLQLTAFLDQFESLRSIHMTAQALIRLETPRGVRTGQGSFVYQEQGDQFRIRCETDRSLGLMDDIEYTYDGKRSSIWFLASNTVTANESFLEEAPTALPNPFYLPLEFAVDFQACPHCRMSLDRVRRAREAEALLFSLTAPAHGQSLETSQELPRSAAKVEARQASGLWVPDRIVRDLPEGGELTIDLRDYETFDGLVFPRTITMQAVDPKARTSMRIDLLVTKIETGRPIEAEAFSSIGNATSTFVVSGDEEKDIPLP
jgi:hypothetical protein